MGLRHSGASMSRAADDVDAIYENIQRIKRKEFPPAPKPKDPWRENLPAPPAEPTYTDYEDFGCCWQLTRCT